MSQPLGHDSFNANVQAVNQQIAGVGPLPDSHATVVGLGVLGSPPPTATTGSGSSLTTVAEAASPPPPPPSPERIQSNAESMGRAGRCANYVGRFFSAFFAVGLGIGGAFGWGGSRTARFCLTCVLSLITVPAGAVGGAIKGAFSREGAARGFSSGASSGLAFAQGVSKGCLALPLAASSAALQASNAFAGYTDRGTLHAFTTDMRLIPQAVRQLAPIFSAASYTPPTSARPSPQESSNSANAQVGDDVTSGDPMLDIWLQGQGVTGGADAAVRHMVTGHLAATAGSPATPNPAENAAGRDRADSAAQDELDDSPMFSQDDMRRLAASERVKGGVGAPPAASTGTSPTSGAAPAPDALAPPTGPLDAQPTQQRPDLPPLPPKPPTGQPEQPPSAASTGAPPAPPDL